MGFPARIYTHGWVLALWIASYMLVPIVAMGLIGRQLNHVARKANALTIPDVLRATTDSRTAGLVATGLIVFFMFFYVLAQFKAGSAILSTLLKDVPLYREGVLQLAHGTAGLPWIGSADPDYLLSLLGFAAVVIVYTTYGGFRAVVWTDVMQGVIMLAGVFILLGLVLWQSGGLEKSTRALALEQPPQLGEVVIGASTSDPKARDVPKGSWLKLNETGSEVWIRTAQTAVIPPGALESAAVPAIRMESIPAQSRIMPTAIAPGLSVKQATFEPYKSGPDQPAPFLSAPGPDAYSSAGFLSITMAGSFFIFWAFGATGQPSNMVRLMAFKHPGILKRALLAVSIYYSLIYFPLVIIFCCARGLMPGMEIDADRVMPELATQVTALAGMGWLGGIVMAAPFAAVMSSVDSFLLLLSSAIVRDVYQRNVNPEATERQIKILTYVVTAVVGVAAVLAAVHPPRFLQDLIIFSTSGLAACFLVPIFLALYWPRLNAAGAIAGMIGGGATHLMLYVAGYIAAGRFAVYELFGIQPFIWDLLGSFLAAVGFSLATRAPEISLKQRFFGKEPTPDRTEVSA